MVQYQLKLKPTEAQESQMEQWFIYLTAVWNWGVRKIELNAKDRIYFSAFDFQNLLADHGSKLGIPSHVLQGTLAQVHVSWRRCFRRIGGKPKLKGRRNKLNSIPFPDPIRPPKDNRISVPGLGRVRFHKMWLPEGKIKCGRIVHRALGWYLCLFINAQPNPIPHRTDGMVGIDPGFSSLLTLSTGEKIAHPRELEQVEHRLAQSQRGRNRKLVARIHERVGNQRKDRNHKLSRRLVAENSIIAFSADKHQSIASRFGKSVSSSSHYQLRSMLAYKCRAGGREYIEVDSKNSTKTCSSCGALTGPTGLVGLKVRQWVCVACGAEHDRDVNAAVNTLVAGVGRTHESIRENASEISA